MTKKADVTVKRDDGTVSERPELFEIPNADIYGTPDAYVVSLDMPGVVKESINLTIDRGQLAVKAAVEPHDTDAARLLPQEIRTTGYHRVFNIGDGIDRINIDARFEDGVLRVKLFKSEDLKLREITIR